MKIKVCGITDNANMQSIASCKPDYMGLIFHPDSKRYVGRNINLQAPISILKDILKVGVFVNTSLAEIYSAVEDYKLDLIQLHGDERPGMCRTIRAIRPVIKAFQINEHFDFESLQGYKDACDYFLFDTASISYGGSGKTFNWTLLNRYKLSVPFFLSGGINQMHTLLIKMLSHPALYGVDINSGFEDAPGIKNTQQIQTFINEIRN